MEQKDELLSNSKCKDCEHLVSRIILPMDYEEFGIDLSSLREEIEEEEGIPIEEEDIAIVHNTCLVLNMDLNHIVIECNKYKHLEGQTIFTKNPWKK